jgi:hypothetical protein
VLVSHEQSIVLDDDPNSDQFQDEGISMYTAEKEDKKLFKSLSKSKLVTPFDWAHTKLYQLTESNAV